MQGNFKKCPRNAQEMPIIKLKEIHEISMGKLR
jgi:hypothetical protein